MKIKEEKKLQINYFSGTDVLRFICATGVIFHHATNMLFEKGVKTFAETIHHFSGSFFLNTFFIISGFLISMILMKEYESGVFSLKNFYMRRIIRIWPLYFLAVLIKILIGPLSNGVPWETVRTNLIYASTFTINFQLLFEKVEKTYLILWSICIEEHIYLIFPFLLLLFKEKFRMISLFLLVAGSISWLYFMHVPSKTTFSIPYFITTSYFFYFGIGVLLACVQNKKLFGKSLEPTLFKPLTQIIVFIIGFSYVFNFWGNHEIPATLFMHGCFGFYLVWASVQENFLFKLKPNLSRYMGNISYAMYIIHIIAITMVINFFKKKNIHFSEAMYGWILPLIATALSIGFSSLLYYYFEKPILKFKKNFTTVLNK